MNVLKIGLLLLSFFIIWERAECSASYYNGGIIFYDPFSRQKLLPPVVTSLNKANSLRLPSIGQPCSCRKRDCGCCAGINIERWNFDQKMCANVTYLPSDIGMKMDVYLNNNTLIMYNVSARNPPPFCMPIGLPIPVNLCIKLSDIRLVNNRVHMCMDWMVQVFGNELFALHFTCMFVGTGGIELSPNGSGNSNGPTGEDQFDSSVYDEIDPESN